AWSWRVLCRAGQAIPCRACAEPPAQIIALRPCLLLLDQLPGAIADSNQLTATLIETTMVLGRHVVHTLSSDELLSLFQCVTQGGAEFRRAGLVASFGSHGDGLLQ